MGHGEGDQAALAVMVNSTAKEGGGNGGGLDMVVAVEAGNKAVEGSPVLILNTKVIYYKTEVDIVSMMSKQAGLDLVIAVSFEDSY